MYVVRVEGFSGEVDDFITYLIVTCDYKTSVSSSEHVTNRKGLQATVAFPLEDRGVNVILFVLKSQNSIAESTVMVNIVSCVISQKPM